MTAKRPRKAPAEAGATFTYLEQLAVAIESGERLDAMGRKLAAMAIRGFAAGLPDAPPRPRGQAPRFNHGDAAMEFLALTCRPDNPLSRTAAIEELAERHGVSIEAMRKVIGERYPT